MFGYLLAFVQNDHESIARCAVPECNLGASQFTATEIRTWSKFSNGKWSRTIFQILSLLKWWKKFHNFQTKMVTFPFLEVGNSVRTPHFVSSIQNQEQIPFLGTPRVATLPSSLPLVSWALIGRQVWRWAWPRSWWAWRRPWRAWPRALIGGFPRRRPPRLAEPLLRSLQLVGTESSRCFPSPDSQSSEPKIMHL